MRFGSEDLAALTHFLLGFSPATNEAKMGDMDFELRDDNVTGRKRTT